jgi:hypothetical protein
VFHGVAQPVMWQVAALCQRPPQRSTLSHRSEASVVCWAADVRCAELLLEQDGDRAGVVGSGAEYYGKIEFAIAVEIAGHDLDRVGSDRIW